MGESSLKLTILKLMIISGHQNQINTITKGAIEQQINKSNRWIIFKEQNKNYLNQIIYYDFTLFFTLSLYTSTITSSGLGDIE